MMWTTELPAPWLMKRTPLWVSIDSVPWLVSHWINLPDDMQDLCLLLGPPVGGGRESGGLNWRPRRRVCQCTALKDAWERRQGDLKKCAVCRKVKVITTSLSNLFSWHKLETWCINAALLILVNKSPSNSGLRLGSVAERIRHVFDTSLCRHKLASQGHGETNTTWFTGVDIGARCRLLLPPHHVPLCPCNLSVFFRRMNCGLSGWAAEDKSDYWHQTTEQYSSLTLLNVLYDPERPECRAGGVFVRLSVCTPAEIHLFDVFLLHTDVCVC